MRVGNLGRAAAEDEFVGDIMIPFVSLVCADRMAKKQVERIAHPSTYMLGAQ